MLTHTSACFHSRVNADDKFNIFMQVLTGSVVIINNALFNLEINTSAYLIKHAPHVIETCCITQ